MQFRLHLNMHENSILLSKVRLHFCPCLLGIRKTKLKAFLLDFDSI